MTIVVGEEEIGRENRGKQAREAGMDGWDGRGGGGTRRTTDSRVK